MQDNIYIYVYYTFNNWDLLQFLGISANPGLGQGRGGAWDHCRCGTSPSSLSTVKPILQPSSHINSFCRLPALKPSKLHPAANSHPAPHINSSYGHSFCRLPALKPSKLHPAANSHPAPHINSSYGYGYSCIQPPPQGHTSMASYEHPSLPFASPKTLQTLTTLQTLQTLKNRKTLQTLTWHASSCSQQPPRATHQWLLMATLAANRHPRATHQWLLMGVQVCRLPALKPSKPFCQPSCSQQAPQGYTSMASYGHPSLPFARPKTLQTLQMLKTLQTLKNRKTLKTLTSHASSWSQQPPCATHQWLLMATPPP